METTILKNKTPKNLEYPFLAQYLDSFIVLFTEEQTGMVIQSDGKTNPVGTISTGWTIDSDPSSWNILNDVTINFKS